MRIPAGGTRQPVQTFLPYPDFAAGAAVLDTRRLGKQRVETLQIARALVWPEYGWKNHPAVAMWRGFVPALAAYGLAVCHRWQQLGHRDTVAGQLRDFTGPGGPRSQRDLADDGLLPPWLGDEAVHLSHRSALLRKDPDHYRDRFEPGLPDDLPYTWPDPAFPRWPLRRGHDRPLGLEQAARLLGVELPDRQARAAVAAVSAGSDAELAVRSRTAAGTVALLAGLCTPGSTAWVIPGEPVRTAPATPMPGSEPAPEGTEAGMTARRPDAAALAAMRAERTADPEFRFLRARQLSAAPAADVPGLLVLDRVAASRPAAWAAVPVLRLVGGGQRRP
ncbi:MSMEG_6728 family protein [Streptomyces sp. NPDC092296]|uniref:MSMEG_6728 family protein n=1 Tax=Streptomyces sp. NPDC092296 TaxID=3366012 RepID=UPI003828A30D